MDKHNLIGWLHVCGGIFINVNIDTLYRFARCYRTRAINNPMWDLSCKVNIMISSRQAGDGHFVLGIYMWDKLPPQCLNGPALQLYILMNISKCSVVLLWTSPIYNDSANSNGLTMVELTLTLQNNTYIAFTDRKWCVHCVGNWREVTVA